jgi:long-chain acyl-CoA synthetase
VRLDVNVYEYLLANARPADTAIISRRESVTYGELAGMAERIGSSLRESGISRGDRVGIAAENSVFWVASYLGILNVGAVAAPFPARLSGETLRRLVDLTQCHAICADGIRAKQCALHLPEECMVATPEVTREGYLAEGARPMASVGCVGGGARAAVDLDERSDLAALMFTSGSTGEPNAVKVSHRNIVANTASIVEYLGLGRDDRMMALLPFDYCFGLSLLHTHLRVGGSLVLNSASQFAEDVLDDMERYTCTGFAGVPSIYQHFLRRSSLSRRALPHLRHAQQAGGKLADTFISEFHTALPHVRFFVMYGQTEATSRLSYLPPERLRDKLGSIGRGIPGVTLRVLDASGRPVSPGEIGEIVAEGDNIASGYWAPDPAKDSFREGKLYTGDLARVDEDGFLYVVGRTSDFIKPNGHRISSKEIEDVLVEMPDIVEAAVIGTPHPDMGEAAKAFIVTRDGQELPYVQIHDHCRGRLPMYAIPFAVEFLPSLPKNGGQKVLKQALGEQALHE